MNLIPIPIQEGRSGTHAMRVRLCRQKQGHTATSSTGEHLLKEELGQASTSRTITGARSVMIVKLTMFAASFQAAMHLIVKSGLKAPLGLATGSGTINIMRVLCTTSISQMSPTPS